MTRCVRWALAATLFLSASSLLAFAPPGIELVGIGYISGNAIDKSGLAGNICQAGGPANCVPKSVLGGFGSALAYTGHDNVFVAAPDRGPFDGLTDVPYLDRFHFPYVFEFDRQGNLVQRIELPSKFLIANQSADPNVELLTNTSGRQANRGMEGLAISPDGFTLFGMMQNALLQDGALTSGTTDRVGLDNRIITIDLSSGDSHEYVYRIEASNRGQGVSEILAINDHQFLVVERDNRSWLSAEPQAPTRKWIYKIDINGATDVSDRTLPSTTLPAGVVPVQKSRFIDLLDADFGLQNRRSGADVAARSGAAVPARTLLSPGPGQESARQISQLDRRHRRTYRRCLRVASAGPWFREKKGRQSNIDRRPTGG